MLRYRQRLDVAKTPGLKPRGFLKCFVGLKPHASTEKQLPKNNCRKTTAEKQLPKNNCERNLSREENW
jgi:hypothetical protein